MSTSVPPPRLRDALEPWCAAGFTGAVRVLDPPGGTVYLVGGLVDHAECSVLPGVDRLLTQSGRVSSEAWRTAAAAGRTRGEIGAELVSAGLLTGVELEAVTRLALYDTAHLLFDAALAARFEPGVRQPLGTKCAMELRAVCQEVDRRARILAAAWPDPSIDTAAVVPVRRLPDQFVALTATQWEVLANADRRHSPIDLARVLGRDAFTMMLEVRRMARDGLVEAGRPSWTTAAQAVAAVRSQVPPPAAVSRVSPSAARADGRAAPLAANPPTQRRPPEQEPTATEGVRLPRRSRSAAMPAPQSAFAECSEDTLVRLRTGLAALQ